MYVHEASPSFHEAQHYHATNNHLRDNGVLAPSEDQLWFYLCLFKFVILPLASTTWTHFLLFLTLLVGVGIKELKRGEKHPENWLKNYGWACNFYSWTSGPLKLNVWQSLLKFEMYASFVVNFLFSICQNVLTVKMGARWQGTHRVIAIGKLVTFIAELTLLSLLNGYGQALPSVQRKQGGNHIVGKLRVKPQLSLKTGARTQEPHHFTMCTLLSSSTSQQIPHIPEH